MKNKNILCMKTGEFYESGHTIREMFFKSQGIIYVASALGFDNMKSYLDLNNIPAEKIALSLGIGAICYLIGDRIYRAKLEERKVSALEKIAERN